MRLLAVRMDGVGVMAVRESSLYYKTTNRETKETSIHTKEFEFLIGSINDINQTDKSQQQTYLIEGN